MKKMACFVEGLTEQTFVCKLIKEIAGANKIVIDLHKRTGKMGQRSVNIIHASSADSEKQFYALISDSSGDSTVKTDILECRENLIAQGHSLIIGLRDVRPLDASEIPKLELGLRFRMPTSGIRICLLLAVMEIEAWFLGEMNHYEHIHSDLTEELIVKTIGFNPSVDNVEERPEPADDLDMIYSAAGLRYKKHKNSINRTVNALDYAEIYFQLPDKINRLKALTDELSNFLS